MQKLRKKGTHFSKYHIFKSDIHPKGHHTLPTDIFFQQKKEYYFVISS